MPLLKQCVWKVAATCVLQSYWRGKIRETSPGLAHYVTAKRAIVCIQRWWKSLRMVKRLTHLAELKHHLDLITAPTLYIEEHIFACLNTVQTNQRTAMKFHECGLFFKPIAGDISVSRNGERALPDWLNLHFSSFKLEAGFSEEPLDQLLRYSADAEKTVLHKVTSNKSYLSDAELSLIQLNFPNIEIAKRRSAMVFLRTVNLKRNLAIKLLTKEALEDDFLMPKLRKVWKTFKVDTMKLARLSNSMRPVIIRAPSPPPPEPVAPQEQTPPKPMVDIESIVKEIEANQSRGESEITTRELAQWRVKRAKEELERKQNEVKAAKELDLSHRFEQKHEEKERIAISLSERAHEARKEIELRKRMRSKEAETTYKIRTEREFVHNFALNCNMLSKQIVKSQITRVRRKIMHERSLFVKEFKEKRSKEREIQESINYERFKMKQVNKDKSTPFIL